MSGYLKVTERPAKPDEQRQIDAWLREYVAEGAENVQSAIGCGRTAWGCGAAAIATPLAVILVVMHPELLGLAVLGLILAIAAGAWLGARRGQADEEATLEGFRTELAQRDAGELPPDTVEVLEAEIAGAVLVDYFSDEGIWFLLLDFGGELAVASVPQDFEWAEFFESRPLHRRFRLVTHEDRILDYEPLSDETVPNLTEEMVPDGDTDGEHEVAFETLHGLESEWGVGKELRRFPGTLATWRADVKRAYAPAGPRSLSRAESGEDGERGLSRPE